VSSLDGSIADTRLTQNTDRDDEPCWSPDGTHILFASEPRRGRPVEIARDGSGPARSS